MDVAFDWETASRETVAHYVRQVRAYPAMVETWREQARKLEREFEEWKGLEQRVREALKEPA